MKSFLVIFYTLLCVSHSSAQKQWKLTIYEKTAEHDTLFLMEKEVKDSVSIKEYLRSYQTNFFEKKYPLASFDTVMWDKEAKKVHAYIFKGPRFENLHVKIAAEDRWIIQKSQRLSERVLANLPLSGTELVAMTEHVLKFLENNGYPFAQVGFSSIQLTPEFSELHLVIDKGDEVRWKKIHLKGDPAISDAFIKTYLGVNEGDLYSEKTFLKITSKINQLQYLSNEQAPQVAFTPEGAELYLYLKTNQTSSANGIVGLQPSADGKVVFTGDIQLKLVNLLKGGEQFDLVWKSLQPQTQQLDVGIDYPFLFKTNFGIEGNFHLYKRDTSFIELRALAGIRYYLGGGSYLRGFYKFESSSLLKGGLNSSVFGLGENVRTNFYGLGLIRKQVDYIPNPTRGFNLSLEGSIGLRSAFPRDTNNSFRETKSTTYKMNLAIEYFIPLARRHVLRLANLSQTYFADTIYVNEQTRFGGLSTQRGFDEESLFATSMSRFSIEYRFLLDKNSNLFAFFDQSIYENTTGNYMKDKPYGFGVGLSFGTKVGSFSISYALGSQKGNPIQIRDGKIHFGYVAFF